MVAIVTEKAAFRAHPKVAVVVLMQGEDRGIGQALVGSVHLEFPMLSLRRQGTEQPTRTENPDTRPYIHPHSVSVEMTLRLRFAQGNQCVRKDAMVALTRRARSKQKGGPVFRSPLGIGGPRSASIPLRIVAVALAVRPLLLPLSPGRRHTPRLAGKDCCSTVPERPSPGWKPHRSQPTPKCCPG